jgi:hypothetical protein
LRAFGRDLTELAKKCELDPVIGRKNEIERVILRALIPLRGRLGRGESEQHERA